MTRTVLLLSLALAAPAHAGQWVTPKPPKDAPAPATAPAAPVATLSPECQKLKDDYLKLRAMPTPERDDARTGEGPRGMDGASPNPEAKAARERYEQRCGALTADMKNAPTPAPNAAHGGQGGAAFAGAPRASAAAPAPQQKFPKKAGPNMGTGSSPERCSQLHQSMKDSLARKDACAKKDNKCRQHAQNGYEQLRSAYHSGCGDIPADAKPGKGKGR